MTKILLVEDNDINRDMLRRRLERKGYQVIVAIDGAEGVAKSQSDQPDLVLMDLHLPVLDGWEATRQIKANPQTQAIPVIALTADALAGEREKALAAGCDEYDTKPVDFTRLLEKMAMLLKPVAPQPRSKPLNSRLDHRLERVWRTQLRQELEPPIYYIIGYSDMLLDTLSVQQNLAVSNDLQKIRVSGLQLLRLVQSVLDPSLVEAQQQDWTIDFLAPAVRRELLTPLSTIIGYCELLVEEAPADLMSDLEQIQASAQQLLNLVQDLDKLMAHHLQAVQSIDLQEIRAAEQRLENSTLATWRRDPTLQTDQALVARNSNILVVDYSASSSMVLRQLERQGYSVGVATIEQQALQLLMKLSYDLVLLDASQPGLRLLEQIKSHEKWQQIPVLMMAAPDEIELTAQAIALGATDYLTKPFLSMLLRAKVTACLEQRQLREKLVYYEEVVEQSTQNNLLESDLTQQIEALQLELEQLKRSQQVAEIVHTDYFQQLQTDVETQEFQDPAPPVALKVLLVEDNELNRDMLSRRLERRGYEVVSANDGAEGVSKAISEQPHVILMDIGLPVMDGWEATQHLKADPQTCRIPVIALTAHAMTGERERALASGCDDYDTKPIELPRLLNKIEQCLKRPTSH